MELWRNSVCSTRGKDAFSFVGFTACPRSVLCGFVEYSVVIAHSEIMDYIQPRTDEQMWNNAPVASHISRLLVAARAGCASFRPRQPATAAGEGEEWSIPHASLHPAGLPVSAAWHD